MADWTDLRHGQLVRFTWPNNTAIEGIIVPSAQDITNPKNLWIQIGEHGSSKSMRTLGPITAKWFLGAVVTILRYPRPSEPTSPCALVIAGPTGIPHQRMFDGTWRDTEGKKSAWNELPDPIFVLSLGWETRGDGAVAGQRQ